MRRSAFFLAVALAGTTASPAGGQPVLVETPSLETAVKAGTLPPVAARVPAQPNIAVLEKHGKSLGRHGGKLHLLMGKQKDTKMMMVYGYARLISYDENLNFVPDLLADFDVQDQRIFTFRLRNTRFTFKAIRLRNIHWINWAQE